jgi:hypothetical protein
MNWQMKLHAMQSLENPLQGLLNMRKPGDWFCCVPGEIGGDGLLRSEHGSGHDPESAINDAWGIVQSLPTDRYLRVKGRNFRWNGFMFEDVSP